MSLPVVELTDGWAVVADIVAWTVVGVAAGYGCHRLPGRRLDHDTALTRLRRFEAGGRWYERVWRIRRWKDRLPEAGALFAGGVSKRRLGGRSAADLEGFVRETRRAELTHWLVLAAGPLFLLWNPPLLALVMLAYAVLANVPFIAVQRYNRARLVRTLAITRRNEGRRRSGRPAGARPPSAVAPPA